MGLNMSSIILCNVCDKNNIIDEERAFWIEDIMNGLNVPFVSSEYGMTELLSQAYSNKEGLFTEPNWMKILIRDTNDPFSYVAAGKTGGINLIDLANIYSCSFIASQDLGKIIDDKFQLLGRFDNADIRGCNLMIE